MKPVQPSLDRAVEKDPRGPAIPAFDGSEASRLRSVAWHCMGKRPHRGGRSELAREIRADARGLHNSLVRGTHRAIPTQGPERAARLRPSLAPGYTSPASAAAAADADFPEDWPTAESLVADTPASPEVDAATAAAPWRRAAGLAPSGEAEQAPSGAAGPAPERRSADGSPAAGRPAASLCEELLL